MTLFLAVAAGAFLFFIVALALVARRGIEFKRLLEDGVPATARVVDKPKFGRVASAKNYQHLRYAYQDAQGREYRHRILVSPQVYDAHEEGGPIEIVYSRGRPEVSAPKYLVDAARTARKP